MTDIIDLPVIRPTSSLRGAFTKMKKHRRSGLVVKKGSDFFLYTATDIRAGISDEMKSVDELKPKYKSVILDAKSLKGSGAGRRVQFANRISSKASGKQFYVLNASASRATIAVGQRQFLAILRSSPPNCQCTGPRHHHEFTIPVTTGDPCPVCAHRIDCHDEG